MELEKAPPAAVAPPAQELDTGHHWRSLKQAAFKGASWTILGQLLSNLIRVAGNLVLARLLFPGAFGVAGIIYTLMTGLQLLSDIGIAQGVMQSKRGDEPDFLNTAWTIQAVRGCLLWLVTVAVAWPYSRFYDVDPWLIVVTGLSSLISGFNSTSLLTLNRKIKLGVITILEIVGQTVGLVSMITLSIFMFSVWPLILGNLIGMAFKMVASHFFNHGFRHRFQWGREAAHELTRFGRWIFISTALSFFASKADQLILGRLATKDVLGLFNVAQFAPAMIVGYLIALSLRVLFPLFARLHEEGPGALRKRMLKIRFILCLVSCIPLCILTIMGPFIVHLIYDKRYEGAGWMLQVLAAGSIVTSVWTTASSFIPAIGDSFRYMLMVLTGCTCNIVAMLVGYHFYDVPGLIIGTAFGVVLQYPVIVLVVRRYRMWQPLFDFSAVGICGVIIAAGLYLKYLIFG